MSGLRRNIEQSCSFSIASMDVWDFWAAAGQVVVPESTPIEAAQKIVVMKAIALRDAPVESERRN